MELSGNTILITGGGSGIGLALCRAFAGLGNTVVISGRNASKLEKAREGLAGVVTLPFDVSDEKDQVRVVDQLARDHPNLNVVINNAAVQHGFDWTDGEDHSEAIREEVVTNLLAPIQLTHRLLPALLRQKHAAVINVSSVLARVPKPDIAVYSGTKAGLHLFTRALRHQLKNTTVKVFEVLPPGVETDMNPGRKFWKIQADQVAREVLRGLRRDRLEIHPGPTKLVFALERILPWAADRMMRG